MPRVHVRAGADIGMEPAASAVAEWGAEGAHQGERAEIAGPVLSKTPHRVRAVLVEEAAVGRGRRRCRCVCYSGGRGGGRGRARRRRRGSWRRHRVRRTGKERSQWLMLFQPRGGAPRPLRLRRGSWAPACGRSTT